MIPSSNDMSYYMRSLISFILPSSFKSWWLANRVWSPLTNALLVVGTSRHLHIQSLPLQLIRIEAIRPDVRARHTLYQDAYAPTVSN
jgi:hypothetical protein